MLAYLSYWELKSKVLSMSVPYALVVVPFTISIWHSVCNMCFFRSICNFAFHMEQSKSCITYGTVQLPFHMYHGTTYGTLMQNVVQKKRIFKHGTVLFPWRRNLIFFRLKEDHRLMQCCQIWRFQKDLFVNKKILI